LIVAVTREREEVWSGVMRGARREREEGGVEIVLISSEEGSSHSPVTRGRVVGGLINIEWRRRG
jgi:hypothetical protein